MPLVSSLSAGSGGTNSLAPPDSPRTSSQTPYSQDAYALETGVDGGASQLSAALHGRGVRALSSGFAPTVLQWKVGLLADEAYCDTLLGRLDAALGDVEQGRAGAA